MFELFGVSAGNISLRSAETMSWITERYIYDFGHKYDLTDLLTVLTFGMAGKKMDVRRVFHPAPDSVLARQQEPLCHEEFVILQQLPAHCKAHPCGPGTGTGPPLSTCGCATPPAADSGSDQRK